MNAYDCRGKNFFVSWKSITFFTEWKYNFYCRTKYLIELNTKETGTSATFTTHVQKINPREKMFKKCIGGDDPCYNKELIWRSCELLYVHGWKVTINVLVRMATTIILHSHCRIIIPGLWPHTDIPSLKRTFKCVSDNWCFIIISLENLNWKEFIFNCMLRKKSNWGFYLSAI